MRNYNEFVQNTVETELVKVGFGEAFIFSIGHNAGLVRIENNMVEAPHWTISLSLPNPLLGNPDIGRSATVLGTTPSEEKLRNAVQKLVEALRQDREQILKMPAEPEARK